MEKTIYEKAIKKWGVAAQLDMCIEECAELIKAVSKSKREINGIAAHEVADEIADVEIMIKQMEYIFEGNIAGSSYRDYIEYIKKEKLERLNEYLKK